MKVVIIEDELAATEALENLINEIAPDMEVTARLQSVEESVEWFLTHNMPDLVFMDIHLADGSSFGIFNQVNISCPIIFTTAYDQYALRAFEVNSVDYLLKPVDRTHLERAIGKLQNLRGSEETAKANISLVRKLVGEMQQRSSYKTALLIPVKDKIVPLPVKNIAYIYTEDKIIRAVCFDGKRIMLEKTLDELFSLLDPYQFYRANRQYIVSRDAVKDASIWFNGRLSLNLTEKTPERIIVSRANVKELKDWLMD